MGMVEGQRQGNRAAQGVPQYQRFTQIQRIDEGRDLSRLGRQVCRRAAVPGGIA